MVLQSCKVHRSHQWLAKYFYCYNSDTCILGVINNCLIRLQTHSMGVNSTWYCKHSHVHMVGKVTDLREEPTTVLNLCNFLLYSLYLTFHPQKNSSSHHSLEKLLFATDGNSYNWSNEENKWLWGAHSLTDIPAMESLHLRLREHHGRGGWKDCKSQAQDICH